MVNSYADRVGAVLDAVERDVGRLGVLSQLLKDKELAYSRLLADIQQNDKIQNLDLGCTAIIKSLFDKVSAEGVKFLEGLVTQALSFVFQDEGYYFKILFGDRAGERTLTFKIGTAGGEFNLFDCGGGVQVLVSFVFRVYFILVSNLRRFVVMDEMFSQLSPQYLDSMVGFLDVLVKEFSFTFLWISHSPSLEGRVTRFYELHKGGLSER